MIGGREVNVLVVVDFICYLGDDINKIVAQCCVHNVALSLVSCYGSMFSITKVVIFFDMCKFLGASVSMFSAFVSLFSHVLSVFFRWFFVNVC